MLVLEGSILVVPMLVLYESTLSVSLVMARTAFCVDLEGSIGDASYILMLKDLMVCDRTSSGEDGGI